MRKLEKYPKYKESGVEWIGEIPEGWNLVPIRAIFSERNEKNSGIKTDYILSVTKDRGVIPYDEKGALGNNKSEDIEKYKLVYPNDFVINKMNVVIGSLGMSKYYGAFSHVYLVYRPYSENVHIEYFSYVFHNPVFYKSLIRICTGIMELRESLNKDEFKKELLPFPSYNEQIKIAKYLDQKTAQIDKAITLKEQLIEKLKERRQILINDAVTKGLDPNVKMKESGVEWIGEIPEGWEVKKFRFLFNFSKGLNITKENLQEEGIPCVNYGEIHSKYGFELDPEIHPLKCVSKEYLKTSDKSFLKKGDFIFADTSEDIEASGSFTYLKSEVPTFAGYHTIITRLKKPMVNRYIAYFFDSDAFRDQVRQKVKGVKVYSITNNILKETLVCLPQLEEQQKIVKYLDKKNKKLDQIIVLEQQQIEKLKEYKATLIDSVVTGKVRVV